MFLPKMQRPVLVRKVSQKATFKRALQLWKKRRYWVRFI